MSSPRALANHGLYLARILLQAWGERLVAEDLAAVVLAQAFAPAVRDHLRRSYGWFLLELAGVEECGPEGPPNSTGELPPAPEGRAESGELRECRQLEQGGWLAGLLAADGLPVAAPGARDNLARPVSGDDREQFEHYLLALDELYGRMRNSLDEY